jgi:hypothetical protein
VNHPAGGGWGPIALGDLNGDGKPDLTLASAEGDGISLLMNDGHGGFSNGVTYPVATGANQLSLADLNGDGHADIIAGSTYGLNVLLNQSDGTFAGAVSYEVIQGPESFAVEDLDGDGRPDLAVADAGGSLSVRLNKGDGTFASATNYPSLRGQVATADFDGDGKPDLVLAFQGQVSVLMNAGGGSFANARCYLSGMGSMILSDLNGDGRPDLTGPLGVILNNGDGTLAAAPCVQQYGAYQAALADFDGDGRLDLAVAGQDVSLQMGTGHGAFAGPISYPLDSYASGLAVGDLNGDGTPDLAVAVPGGGSIVSHVSVLINDGKGALGAPVAYPVGARVVSLTLADLNGDGRPDLVVTDAGQFAAEMVQGAKTIVLFNNGDGTFAAWGEYMSGNPSVGDLNGDGKLDLVIVRGSNASAVVLLNQGNGTFAAAQSYPVASFDTSAAVADLNGDGLNDLVIGGHVVFLGKADGTLAPGVNAPASGGPFAIGDLNGDAYPDLTIANSTGDVNVLLNFGDGTFASAATYASPDAAPGSVSLGDLNGDGKPDFVGLFNGAVAVFTNTSP